MITWNCKTFNELSVKEFHDIIALRISVFVVEQKCAFQELDGLDYSALHVFGTNEKNEIVAVARLIPVGIPYAEASIGRISTRIDYRRSGLGRPLMDFAMSELYKAFGNVPIKIMAQKYLEKFYTEYGFASIGADFIEDDIVHVYMICPSKS